MKNLFQEALNYFGLQADDAYVRARSEQLIYCYQNNKDLLDFDFWTRYEDLLGEKLSYEEYVVVDDQLDGSPFDIEPENESQLRIFQVKLKEFRAEEAASMLSQIESEEQENYTFVASKSVLDADGFSTDYTWYKAADDTHVFVFGDNDIYKPEDGYFDNVCNDEREAREWFDSYKGFVDEEPDKSSLDELVCSAKAQVENNLKDGGSYYRENKFTER